MQFVSKIYFNLFFLIPVLVFFFIIVGAVKKKRCAAFASGPAMKKINYNHSGRRDILRVFLIMIAVILIIIALAQPQWGKEQVEVKHLGLDIMFLIDTSMSMLAEDVPPNRIIKAKLSAEALTERLKGNRVGLIAFAGSSYLECPLTIDYSAFRLFLNAINVGFIPDPGTVFSTAIAKATRALGEKGSKSKVIIILSDGEDHERGIDPVLLRAKKKGIRIYCIGIGRKQGDPIPLKDRYGTLKGHKKDRTGAVVLTKLQDKILHELAQKTGGLYYPATVSEKEIDIIAQHIQNLEKEEFGSRLLTQREAKYHIFLLVALVVLLIEFMIGQRKRGAHLRMTAQAIALCAFFLLNTAFSDGFSKEMWRGNELYRQQDYESAIEEYKKGQIKEPDSDNLLFNMGNAYYSSGNYAEAKKMYKQALNVSSDDPAQKIAILYNLGNAQYRLGEIDPAIESYKRALDIKEEDNDVKFNLEYLLKKKSMMDKENQDKKPEQKDKQDEQKNKDEQDQDSQGQQKKNDEEQDKDQEQKKEDKQGESDQDQEQDQQSDQEEDQNQEQGEEDKKEGDTSEQEQSQQDQQEKQQDQQQPEQQEPEAGDDQRGSEQESDRIGDEDKQDQGGEAPQEEYEAPEQPGAEEQTRSSGGISEDEAKRILSALQEAEEELGNVSAAAPRHPEYRQQEKDW